MQKTLYGNTWLLDEGVLSKRWAQKNSLSNPSNLANLIMYCLGRNDKGLYYL